MLCVRHAWIVAAPGRNRIRVNYGTGDYKRLKRGTYTFEERAVGAGGRDPSPAKKRFTIK
jgi:hypothetical protein